MSEYHSAIKKTVILFIHHGKGLGGAPLSLLHLIQGLDTSVYRPIVLFLHDSEIIDLYKKNKIETIGPIEVMDFPHTNIWWFRWYHATTLIKAIKDFFKTIFVVAPRILKEHKPDIVHLNTSSLIGWGYTAGRLNIPVVWHIREPLAHGYIGIRKKVITWFVKQYSHAIVAISHHDAKPWQKEIKTHVVYNPVNEKKFNASINTQTFLNHYHLKSHVPRILFLGGFSQEKGVHVILSAFKHLRAKTPQAQLLIAGNTHQQTSFFCNFKRLFPAERFRKHIKNLMVDLEKSVTILGNIDDVPSAMAASNIIVFPATVGHFARPIIEAGFMKKPVIASNLAPLDEIVIDGKTGYLLPPHNYIAWADTLHKLLEDEQLSMSLGNAAYRFCTVKCNQELHVLQIHTIYQQILSKESD